MLSLHQILLAERHIVTEIVEAELVVRSESDVAGVCAAAGVGIRLVLVDAVDAESVEHIERTHPFGVTLGEVVIHGDHMHALARKRVQEHGQRRDESLSLTRGHLGNLSLMKDDAADELHIVMDHVPGDSVASGRPAVVPHRLVRSAVRP